jgi:hypothetical protein
MDKNYCCYCGLYCENCATKAKVEPAAKVLYAEMKKAGFEDVIHFLPDGEKFWSFLKGMAEQGACVSCKAGSGDPGCVIRKCAIEKGVEMCAFCEDYPCDNFTKYFEALPVFKHDNALLKEEGWEAWSKLQDERKAKGFTYTETKQER